MRILLLSPYHGGSHKAWAEGYRDHSVHDVTILSLPARFWKWRMEGGAVTMARLSMPLLTDPQTMPDLILTTDMLDLARFMALTRSLTAHIPFALYMHENQLTYPLPKEPGTGPMRRQFGARDRHFVLTNLTSMLAADRVFFNSDYHRQTLLEAVPPFLRHYPEYNELEMVNTLEANSSTLPVGIDFGRLDPPLPRPVDRPPLILWNQRWEFDKNPVRFVDTLLQLANEGVEFEVAFCGERFGLNEPDGSSDLLALRDRVIFNGYANEEDYRRLLWQASVTFSTAWHEYFGVSILEAIHCQTMPLLPPRLSYPEIIPSSFHDVCLVDSADLMARLKYALTHSVESQTIATELAQATADYAWTNMGAVYDAQFEALANGPRWSP